MKTLEKKEESRASIFFAFRNIIVIVQKLW